MRSLQRRQELEGVEAQRLGRSLIQNSRQHLRSMPRATLDKPAPGHEALNIQAGCRGLALTQVGEQRQVGSLRL